MEHNSIPLEEARIYWNDYSGKVIVGTFEHPAREDEHFSFSKGGNMICMTSIFRDHTKAPETEAIADLFGNLLWLHEHDRIDLKNALKEIRKIDGVSEWLDFKKYWS